MCFEGFGCLLIQRIQIFLVPGSFGCCCSFEKDYVNSLKVFQAFFFTSVIISTSLSASSFGNVSRIPPGGHFPHHMKGGKHATFVFQ